MRNLWRGCLVGGGSAVLLLATSHMAVAQLYLEGAAGTRPPTIESFARAVGGNTSLQDVVSRQATAPSPGSSINMSRGMGSRGLGIGRGGPVTKPFSYVNQEPTVSPYQNLFRTDLGDAAPNYYSLVRPQLNQMQFNRQQQLQNQQIHRQMQDLQSQNPFSPRGSQQMFPTGHSTIFGYLSRFYPSARRRR